MIINKSRQYTQNPHAKIIPADFRYNRAGARDSSLKKGGEKTTVGMYRFGISLAAYLASNLKITSKPLSREELLSWKNRNRNSSYSSLTSYLAMSFSSVSPKRCS
ncbi:hypothetical protein SAMN05216283_10967 [Sunxiuqinia elliptica]|uniref:Uncharacterized protein n=1 Tax=Sunxiuqinia elliptica TaxID=655355 RepID=A0A1I2JSJ9_9BACT|nr:hypothetical protein SAMN05216283_10967 [Sunxiuqinia elliptica]